MRILDYYIFKEQTKIFLVSVFIILAAFLLEKVNFLSNLFLAQKTPASTVALLMLYLCPAFLTLAAPLAVLMASLMTFARMASDNEITAMRAGGLSFERLLIPVMVFSSLAAAATLYLSINYAHVGNLMFHKTAVNILSQSFEAEIRERRFYSSFPGLMIYVNENNGGRLSGVFISDSRVKGAPTVIEASSGMVVSDQDEGVVTLALKDGVIHSSGLAYRTLAFHEYSVRIDLGLKDKPLEKETPQMSIPELKESIRKNEMEGKPAYRETVEIHKKYAIPLGCLALGALGALAGVMTHRRGSSGGFGMGVILIVINYLLTMIGIGLGSGGKIPPALGVWGPVVLMAMAAVAVFLRVSKDTMPTKAEIWIGEAWLNIRRRLKKLREERMGKQEGQA